MISASVVIAPFERHSASLDVGMLSEIGPASDDFYSCLSLELSDKIKQYVYFQFVYNHYGTC